MVCIYCAGSTRVANSRPQKRLMQVWRRRVCARCGAIFTTNEVVDLSTSLVVQDGNHTTHPFSRDILFVSILRAVGHRQQPIEDASALCATITSKLLHKTTQASLSPLDIIAMTHDTLQHFDTAAAVQYNAYHQ
jgi:transcriptional repressor NrdR